MRKGGEKMANYPEICSVKKFKEFLNNVSDDAMLYARNGGIAMANDEDFWAINCLTEMDYRCDYSCCAGEDCYDDLYMDY